MAALGGALIETGQTARARQIIAPWWYKAKLSAQEEQLVLKKAGAALLPADHLQRMHINQSDSPDTNSVIFGLSVEDEVGMLDNRLRLTPGLRYDWYDHRPQDTYTYEHCSRF